MRGTDPRSSHQTTYQSTAVRIRSAAHYATHVQNSMSQSEDDNTFVRLIVKRRPCELCSERLQDAVSSM
jgi:hypothetical protein